MDNEEKYLKILKKQDNDLKKISQENRKINSEVENNIEETENLLKKLGYKLPETEILISKEITTKPKVVKLREFEDIEKEALCEIKEKVEFSDLLTTEEINKVYDKIKYLEEEYKEISKVTCDKYDYLISSVCGVIAGLIDVVFVGSPFESKLGNNIDASVNSVIKKIAKFSGWSEDKALARGSDTIKSAIGFLERNYKVNYDQQTGKAVDYLFKMNSKNHHLKSLGHSLSPIGLLFSIINQFTGTSTFISDGKLITIESNFELKGNNFVTKIYAGFINWFIHIVSDMGGSSGAKGRGSGIPIPFYELLQILNIGKIGKNQKTIADISVLVFENGYDFRHGITMSIPVILNELLVRFCWALKLYFYENKTFKEIIPLLRENRNLKRMLFVSQGCFCLMDLGDAVIRNIKNPEPVSKIVSILTRMNLIAWLRFSKLGYDELKVILFKEYEKNKYIDQKIIVEWLELVKETENYEFV